METTTERGIGHLFGLLGGLLIFVGGLVAGIVGIADLALGRTFGAGGAFGAAAVLLVVGAVAFLFAYLGEHSWKDRPVPTGVMLVVLAAVDWAALARGPSVLAIIGGILVLLAGVLYLIAPTQHAVSRLATSG
jgi:hypothetical protein